jgi:hypothetical protein
MATKENVSKTNGLFLLGLLLACVVSLRNFHYQTTFAEFASDNDSTPDDNYTATNTTQLTSTYLMNSGIIPTDADTKPVSLCDLI